MKFSKLTFAAVYEVFEVANDWLLNCIHRDIAKRMAREEKRQQSMAACQKPIEINSRAGG